MRPKLRQNAILDLLRQHERLSVAALAERLAISQESIRRDLTALASRNLVRKLHGSATLPPTDMESPFNVRVGEMAAQKRQIARAAAALPGEGDSLFIDTGSTTIAFAEELARRERLTVVTNSPAIADRLARTRRFTGVFLLGGQYHAEVDETVGPLCCEQIRRFRTVHAFLTVGAVSPDGFMNFDIDEAEVARTMVEQADEVTLLADSSKFKRTALFEVGPLSAVRRLVTDGPPPERLARALEAAGVEVIIAKADQLPDNC